MTVFRTSKRGVVGLLALSVLGSVLGLAPAAQAVVYRPCNAHDLREAVNAANTNPGTDTVMLSAKCKYVFTMGDVLTPAPGAAQSALAVTDDLIVAGNGATIKASGNGDLRHLVMYANLTLNNVTLTGGRIESPDAIIGAAVAGSILGIAGDLRGEKLTVKNNRVTAVGGEVAAAAGGILVAGGDVTLVRSVVDDNEVNGYGLTGGAVIGGVGALGGDLNLTRSSVRGNDVNAGAVTLSIGGAGGVAAGDTFGGLFGLNMVESTVSGNTVAARGLAAIALAGGILLQAGPHTMSESTVSGNKTTAEGPAALSIGGGVLNAGELSDSESTFSGNKAVCRSEGFCVAAGGGYANVGLNSDLSPLGPGSAEFEESTFTGNKVEAKGGVGAGGGLAVAGGTTLLTEATVTKNEAKGAVRLGGGIANFGDPLDVDIDASDIFKNKPRDCYNVPACDD